jgi:hypothetical protein
LTGVLYLSLLCCNLERLLAMKRLPQIIETNEAGWEKLVRSPERVCRCTDMSASDAVDGSSTGA